MVMEVPVNVTCREPGTASFTRLLLWWGKWHLDHGGAVEIFRSCGILETSDGFLLVLPGENVVVV